MKIESTAFTRADVEQFLEGMLDHDRQLLADRLEKASSRLAALGPRVKAGPGGTEWSHHELLAHIAVLSKFYGVLVHKISSGQMSEIDLLENVNLRDVVGEQMAQIEPAELLQMALADQARTQTEGSSDLGAQEFNGVCAKCHGGLGQGGIGPALATSSVIQDQQALDAIVRNGRNLMPAVGEDWSARQMDALFSYLKKRFGKGSGGG
jgi:mono/diheme cytochrome c family protein